MKKLIYISIFVVLGIFLINDLNSKSSYKDGNYSEAGGCSRMCMRCHMGSLNPKGLVLNIKSDKTVIKGGDTITVTATISGFSGQWSPGLALMVDRYSQYASHTPQEYGWEVLSNSNSNQFNFFRIQNNDTVFYWKLKAPNYPGIYRLATSAFFSDQSTGVPVQCTKRGDNSLVVTVNKSDFIHPQIDQQPEVAYRNFFIYRFPVPIDSARVMAHKNSVIRRREDTTDLKISNIWQTRDNKTIIIKTEQPMYPDKTYSWFYTLLNDYSITTGGYTGNAAAVTNPEPYRIYAEFSQDVTKKEIKLEDRTEYLGNNGGDIHRINLVFFLPDNPVDLLPVEKITKATLCLTPKNISKPAQALENWTVTKLIPGTNWYDYFGNNQTVQTNWSGYNPVSPPIASLPHNVPAVVDTSIAGKWRWDITKDFIERFKILGGNGTNTADYCLRIQAANESSSTGGIGFYGSDADSMSNMPYIELELDTTRVAGVDESQKNTDFQYTITPNPATDFIKISGINHTLQGVVANPDIRIYNSIGETIINPTPALPAGDGVKLDISSLPPGIYFCSLNSGMNVITKSFVVVR